MLHSSIIGELAAVVNENTAGRSMTNRRNYCILFPMRKGITALLLCGLLLGCRRDEAKIAGEAVEAYEALEADQKGESWGGEDLFGLSVNYFSAPSGGRGGRNRSCPISDAPMEAADWGPVGGPPRGEWPARCLCRVYPSRSCP